MGYREVQGQSGGSCKVFVWCIFECTQKCLGKSLNSFNSLTPASIGITIGPIDRAHIAQTLVRSSELVNVHTSLLVTSFPSSITMSHHSHDQHAPRTKPSHKDEPDTIPTVSATGMPRIFPRHKDKRSKKEEQQFDEKEGGAPPEVYGQSVDHPHHGSGSEDEDEEEEDDGMLPSNLANTSSDKYPATGSLTLAALNPYSSIPVSRRFALIAGSVFINLGLPFLNGVMLGFGEIFARVVMAPALGITGVGWSGDTARAIVSWPWLGKRPPQSTPISKDNAGGSFTYRNPDEYDDWSPSNATQNEL